MRIGLIHTESNNVINGRNVATSSFEEALIKYHGTHDISIIDSRISLKDLTEELLLRPLDALHIQEPSVHRVMHFKNINPKPLVVTGITHSLGFPEHVLYQPLLEAVVLNDFAGHTPHDLMFCTSNEAALALNKIESHLGVKHMTKALAPLGIEADDFYKNKKINPINLLYLGRIDNETKCNMDYFLEMLCEARENKDFTLTIAGASSKNITCDLDWVTIECNVTEERKKELLANADIFLAPSDNVQETFGISLLEAMSSGLPIIAYDWSGYRSIIIDELNGHLIKTEMKNGGGFPDRGMFVEKLRELIDDEEKRISIGNYNEKYVREIFNWEHVIKMFIGLWEKSVRFNKQNISNLIPCDNSVIFSHYSSK